MTNAKMAMALIIVIPLVISVLGFRSFFIARKGYKELRKIKSKDKEHADKTTQKIVSSLIGMLTSLLVGIIGAVVFFSMIATILSIIRKEGVSLI